MMMQDLYDDAMTRTFFQPKSHMDNHDIRIEKVQKWKRSKLQVNWRGYVNVCKREIDKLDIA